jgi:hypothetical protein
MWVKVWAGRQGDTKKGPHLMYKKLLEIQNSK